MKKHGKRRIIKKVSSSRDDNFEDDPGSPIKEYQEIDKRDFIKDDSREEIKKEDKREFKKEEKK